MNRVSAFSNFNDASSALRCVCVNINAVVLIECRIGHANLVVNLALHLRICSYESVSFCASE